MIMMMMMQGDRHPQAEGAADSGVEQEHEFNYCLDLITVLDLNKRQQFNGVDSFQIPTFREHT